MGEWECSQKRPTSECGRYEEGKKLSKGKNLTPSPKGAFDCPSPISTSCSYLGAHWPMSVP